MTDIRMRSKLPILLTSVALVLIGIVVFAGQHGLPPSAIQQAGAVTPQRSEPRALTAAEEGYAASLWEIHREVTPSAVGMSFAGIAYETDGRDVARLEQRVVPIAKFFGDAEQRVRALTAPPSLAQVHDQYISAMVLYRNASRDMLAFVKDGDRQHLIEAQALGVAASEGLLRAGEVLWPGQYKPH